MAKKLLILFFGICWLLPDYVAGNIPQPKKYESFEGGIPQNWSLKGKGKLSLNLWHYKHGRKSLQWDFAKEDEIVIKNTLGDLKRIGGWGNYGRAAFGMSIYLEKPLKNEKLQLQFRTDDKTDAILDIPLNFSCWQSVFVYYNNGKLIKGRVTQKTNNIVIKAPAVAKGRIYLDMVVYNGLLIHTQSMPRKSPWLPPQIDAGKFPLPEKISEKDLLALERVESLLPGITITDKPQNIDDYLFYGFRQMNMVEDAHGVRGEGVTYMGHMNTIKTFCEGLGIKGLKTFYKDIGIPCMMRTGTITKNKKLNTAQVKELEKNGVMLMKHLLDQGFNTSGHFMYYATHKDLYFHFVYLLRDAMAKAGILKVLVNYLQYYKFALFAPPKKMDQRIDMDYFLVSRCYFMLALMQGDKKKQIQALRYATYKLSKEILVNGCRDGFKADGSAYHHSKNYYSYANNALGVLTAFACACRNSSFAFSKDALQVLKKTMLNMAFYTNNEHMPLVMRGRIPFSILKYQHPQKAVDLSKNLKKLALAMNDKALAQAYVDLKPEDKIFSEKFNLTPTGYLQGNLAMPYGGIVVQRRKNWLALACGYGKYYSGSEVYVNSNRFGMYIPNGSLEILGPKGGLPKDLGGWDWNRIGGTTVIYYPVGKMRPSKKGRPDLTTPFGFFGGISWRKRNGCFAMKIYGRSYDESFEGNKTYFMIEDRIYALGSNISCKDKNYPVQTNLYQKHLAKKTSSTAVDGTEIKTFPVPDKALDCNKSHHLLDSVGNGYYLPEGQNVFYARKQQINRDHYDKKDTSGDFATAWINHGISPNNAGYEYVVLPFCGEKRLLEFSSENYEILRKDRNAHIIHDKIADIYGAVFFKKARVKKLPYVLAVDRNCMIMYKKNSNKLEVAVGDPDPHRRDTRPGRTHTRYWRESQLTPLRIIFAGSWKQVKPVDGVKIIRADKNKTVIEFGCIDGKTFDFELLEE